MKEIQGDLLEYFVLKQFDLIGHQCNCFHSFGSGIAKQIKETFPEAFAADLLTIRGDLDKLGTFQKVPTQFGIILNIYAQYDTGKGLRTNYDALGLALYKINKCFPGRSIGLPLIGCGQGGGDWDYVKLLIEWRLTNMDVTIVKLTI